MEESTTTFKRIYRILTRAHSACRSLGEWQPISRSRVSRDKCKPSPPYRSTAHSQATVKGSIILLQNDVACSLELHCSSKNWFDYLDIVCSHSCLGTVDLLDDGPPTCFLSTFQVACSVDSARSLTHTARQFTVYPYGAPICQLTQLTSEELLLRSTAVPCERGVHGLQEHYSRAPRSQVSLSDSWV
jgi:hypothetical protein